MPGSWEEGLRLVALGAVSAFVGALGLGAAYLHARRAQAAGAEARAGRRALYAAGAALLLAWTVAFLWWVWAGWGR